MKKTLFAFSVTVVLSIAVFLGIGLSGCEWFNTSILGKPSEVELAVREKQRQDELSRLDSIRKAEAEKLVNMQTKDELTPTATTNINTHTAASNVSASSHKTYHVIVGSYEEQANIDHMMNTLKKNGYSPYTIKVGSLTGVSAGSFDSERDAYSVKEKLEEKELCEEAWIYKK